MIIPSNTPLKNIRYRLIERPYEPHWVDRPPMVTIVVDGPRGTIVEPRGDTPTLDKLVLL